MAAAMIAPAMGDVPRGVGRGHYEDALRAHDKAIIAAARLANPMALVNAVAGARVAAKELGHRAEEHVEDLLRCLNGNKGHAAGHVSPVMSLPGLPTLPEPAQKPGSRAYLASSLPPETMAGMLAKKNMAAGAASTACIRTARSPACEEARTRAPSPRRPVSPRRPASVERGPVARRIVSVIAPGAGAGMNSSVYQRLGAGPNFEVRMLGRSHEAYDRYPAGFPNGGGSPNLATFAQEILSRNLAANSDCLVCGSRGGQVVLPLLWKAWGDATPPALVINSGCAMQLPTPVSWPKKAVSFLLLGGQDYFRGTRSHADYVEFTRRHVPAGNETTAILYVHEMSHMPQPDLLSIIIERALQALGSWKATGTAPSQQFGQMVSALVQGGWSGRMLYTAGNGAWQDMAFGPQPRAPVRVRRALKA